MKSFDTRGSRSSVASLAAPAATALVALALVACSATGRAPTAEPQAAPAPHATGSPPAAGEPAPTAAWTAEVVRVIDGDTLDAVVVDPAASGYRAGDERRLRLLRIDAPERGREDRPAECLSAVARDALAALARGRVLRLEHDRAPLDRFGRDLVHAWNAEGVWLNGALLREGLARVVTFEPNDGREREVRAAEQEARRRGVGLWDPGRCPRSRSAGTG